MDSQNHCLGQTGRVFYADWLRILAVYMMILVHVAAGNWSGLSVYSNQWQAHNFYDGLARWCVPVFVMLSGMFLLNPEKELSVHKLYRKHCLRIVTAFFFWSLVYSIIGFWMAKRVGEDFHFFEQLVAGRYHLWFLYMILGLYLIVPILRVFLSKACKKDIEYFLLLAFVFSSVLWTLVKIPQLQLLKTIYDKMYLQFVVGYTGYFVAGFYFRKYPPHESLRSLMVFAGALGGLVTILGTGYLSMSVGYGVNLLYSYFSPNVVLTSVGIFVLAQGISCRQGPGRLAQDVFGIYLIHDLWNIFFREIGFSTQLFQPWISIPVISLCILICSAASIRLLRCIPLFRKYCL